MKKITIRLKKGIFYMSASVFLVLMAFKTAEESTLIIHQTLNKYYDLTAEGAGLKRYELNVTNTGFCKYKKVYTSGKTEFFSFNLARFKNLEYYGSSRRESLFCTQKMTILSFKHIMTVRVTSIPWPLISSFH